MAVKKKAAPKKRKPITKDDYIAVNLNTYGNNYLTSAYDSLINNMLPKEPENLEAKVAYWKDKYERSSILNNKFEAQIKILESIIDKALARSCRGD